MSKLSKIIPKSKLECFFWLPLLYIFIVFTLPFPSLPFAYYLGYPIFWLFENLIPKDAGLGAISMAIGIVVSLIVFILVAGLLTVRLVEKRFAKSLLLLTLVGFISIIVSSKIQDSISNQKYQLKKAKNNELALQISVEIKDCTRKEVKEEYGSAMVYSLVCMAKFSNLPSVQTIEDPNDRFDRFGYSALLELWYKSDPNTYETIFRTTTYIRSNPISSSEDVELIIPYSYIKNLDEVYFAGFVLNIEYDSFENLNLNIPLMNFLNK